MDKNKYFMNLVYDEPVMFKGLELYPVTVRDYYKFYSYSDCLVYAKNDFPLFISKTYLDFLYETDNDENNNMAKLHFLLGLVLKKDLKEGVNIFYGKDSRGRFSFQIEDIVYNGQDFEELRDIISEMNGLELPDENIPKKLREQYDEFKKLKSGNNSKMAGLEDVICALSVNTGFKLDDIYGFTIRKFNKMIERVDMTLHYSIFLQASLSGMVEFKDKSFIKHWLTSVEKGSYEDMFTSVESVENKISLNDLKN